jgi:hypothetical protein
MVFIYFCEQKCSACSKTRPKMHGAPVQCTKGKCAKAFHVNCARDGHAQGILLGVLREVDKEVISLNNIPVSAVPRPPALGTDENHMSLDAMKTMQQHDSSSESVFKVVKKLEVQILCTQHNPVRYFNRSSRVVSDRFEFSVTKVCIPGCDSPKEG